MDVEFALASAGEVILKQTPACSISRCCFAEDSKRIYSIAHVHSYNVFLIKPFVSLNEKQ